MEFKNRQAIYLQITDYISDRILTGKWPAGEKIVSIRELAVCLEVNPNTVLRAYESLQQQGVIFNRRGIGYFVEATAPDKIREIRRQRFFEQDLPEFIQKIQMLGISFDAVTSNFPST
jgi:DNA-binding transcriptional regulator YhcF (GntR family)